MNKYEDESMYTDGEDKKPKLFIIIGFVVLAIVILVLIISCSFSKKNSNNYLSYVKVSNGELAPAFNKEVIGYTITTEEDIITISCGVEDSKAKVDGCNKRISLTEDKTIHNVIVTAEDGSARTYKFSINPTEEDELANLKVSITSDVASGKETNKEVTLTAKLEPQIMNAKYQWYQNGKEISGANQATYTANTSGSYFVRITTATSKLEVNSDVYVVKITEKSSASTGNNGGSGTTSNNSSNYTLKINSVSGNVSEWSKKVTLTINATASNGLAAKAYSFDGGKTYQQGKSKTFTKNQTVNIVVKDSKGNKVNKTVTISKVDATVPTAKIVASNTTSTSVTLSAKVTPSSTVSGYKYQWYKGDKAISGATSVSYKVTSSGNYKVKITTGAGNTVTTSAYSFMPETGKLTCPTLTVTTVSGAALAAETWTTEQVYMKIEPSKYTASYDVYMNEYNNFSTISSNFNYYETHATTSILKITKKGMRRVKFVIRDVYGNSTTCFSLAYYLK